MDMTTSRSAVEEQGRASHRASTSYLEVDNPRPIGSCRLFFARTT